MTKPVKKTLILLGILIIAEAALYIFTADFALMFLPGIVAGFAFVLWVTPVNKQFILFVSGKNYMKSGNYLVLLIMFGIALGFSRGDESFLFKVLITTIFFLFFILFVLFFIHVMSILGLMPDEENNVIVSKLNDKKQK